MSDWRECSCGRGLYESQYSECYDCFQERISEYEECILCGRPHRPEYAVCFRCAKANAGTGTRIEAAQALKQYVLHRDGHACRECGATRDLQIDHVLPCAKGGDASRWNLQVLCAGCNVEKGADYTDLDRDVREELLGEYFLNPHWRCFLTDEERTRIGEAVRLEVWR